MTTIPQRLERAETAAATTPVSLLVRVLTWPVISLLLTGCLHFAIEAVAPDMRTLFVPAVLAPLLLAYGLWVGVRTVTAGGGYGTAIVAAAILGLLPVALDVVGFGAILGRGVSAGAMSAAFAWALIMFGALIGAGFMLSGRTDRR